MAHWPGSPPSWPWRSAKQLNTSSPSSFSSSSSSSFSSISGHVYRRYLVCSLLSNIQVCVCMCSLSRNYLSCPLVGDIVAVSLATRPKSEAQLLIFNISPICSVGMMTANVEEEREDWRERERESRQPKSASASASAAATPSAPSAQPPLGPMSLNSPCCTLFPSKLIR